MTPSFRGTLFRHTGKGGWAFVEAPPTHEPPGDVGRSTATTWR